MTDIPRAILFACNLNSIRSPMAAALTRRRLAGGVHVDSCGVWEGGYVDPFMVQVMREAGIELEEHAPKTFDDLDDANYDLIVALTPESKERADAFAKEHATEVEFWPVPDPTQALGSREARLAAYREARDALDLFIRRRFSPVSTTGG